MRKKISILLILIALLLVLMPGSGTYSFVHDPEGVVSDLFGRDIYVTADQAAMFLVTEDSTVQMIDLRPAAEFRKFNIPGSINIPIGEFFSSKPETWLYNRDTRYLFYSNDETWAGYALALASGLGYQNCYILKGGLNQWFETVMNSTFSGERITARENALFETRTRARRFFTEINSLPDSLKLKYAESRRQAERDLDGGCE